MLIKTYEAAATLIVGTDVFRNERNNVSSKPRVMRGIAMVGANAINEASVDVYIEDFFVGNFRNTVTGVVGTDMSQDTVPVGPFAVPPGSKISGIVRVAPTVSPLLMTVV